MSRAYTRRAIRATGSHAMTRKFFFFSEMGYNAYPSDILSATATRR